MSRLILPSREIIRPSLIVPGRASMNLQGYGPGRGHHRSPMLVNPSIYAAAGGGGSNLAVAVGGLNAPASSTTGASVTLSGLSFQPKLVFFWMTGRTETSDAAAIGGGNPKFSFGFSDGSSGYAWGATDIDTNANSNTGFGHNTGVCLARAGFQFNDAAWRGLSCTMTSDGFTLAVAAGSSYAWVAHRIQFLALGGSDLSAKVGSTSVSSGSGNTSLTPSGLSFQPVGVVFGNAPYSTGTGFQNTPVYTIGAASGAGAMWTFGGCIQPNSGTSNTDRYFRTDECHTLVDSGGVGAGGRIRMVSMDAAGFTVNRLEMAGAIGLPYAAIGGVLCKVGSFTANSAGATVSGIGFTPKAILFLTHGTTESTADATQADMMYSIGAVVTGLTHRCSHVRDVDNQANMIVTYGHRDDSVIMTSNTSRALDSRIAVSALNSDGFDYTMPTSTLNGYKVGFVALG